MQKGRLSQRMCRGGRRPWSYCQFLGQMEEEEERQERVISTLPFQDGSGKFWNA